VDLDADGADRGDDLIAELAHIKVHRRA